MLVVPTAQTWLCLVLDQFLQTFLRVVADAVGCPSFVVLGQRNIESLDTS